jgi:hypothetical protein
MRNNRAYSEELHFLKNRIHLYNIFGKFLDRAYFYQNRTWFFGPVTKINETFTVDTPRSVVYKSIYFRAMSFVVLFLQWFEPEVVFQHEVKRRQGSLRYDVIFLTLTLCK